jgi:type I restriction enzyme S subunit
MKWNEYSLNEIGTVNRGKSKHRPRDAAHLFGGPYPFIQTGDVKHSNLYVTSYSQTYSEAGLRQGKLWQKGTLCITIAANIADTAILNIDACFPDSVIGFIPDESKCDVKYIKYKFDLLQRQFKQFSQGAAQDNLSLKKLNSLKFSLPSLPIQKKIAAILSAYDDRIENNLKRITLLEKSAKLLYEDWFLRLRFPGYERTKVVNEVPEGWNQRAVGDLLLKIKNTKKIPKGEYLENGKIPCVDQSATYIGGYTDDVDALIKGPLPLIVFGDHTRILKYVDFPFAKGADGTQLLYPNEDKITPIFFYYALCFVDVSNYFYARHFKFLKAQDILIPTKDLIGQFTSLATPVMEQVKILRAQNQKLIQARDILLPKLINGEIAV